MTKILLVEEGAWGSEKTNVRDSGRDGEVRFGQSRGINEIQSPIISYLMLCNFQTDQLLRKTNIDVVKDDPLVKEHPLIKDEPMCRVL